MEQMSRPLRTVTPTEVGNYLKGILTHDRFLSSLSIEGELTNFRKYPSGHLYFSLKDETGVIACVMFQREATRLSFTPENGMHLIATGSVTTFPRDGKYQLYCKRLHLQGVGELHQLFEQLKYRLAQEGLFAPEQKQKLPFLPKTVALITSPAGAVVRDMIRILKERCPYTKVLVVPVPVQGQEAASQMAAAIHWSNYHQIADLLILGRGGGSMEDLWAFNDEGLARAIFASRLPVVSAVGHEPDVTITDFVADVRAATPTHAAELVVPLQSALQDTLDQYRRQLSNRILSQVRMRRRFLGFLAQSPALKDPYHHLREKALQVDKNGELLRTSMIGRIQDYRHQLQRIAASLDALSPLKVMGRGYAIPRTQQGDVLGSVSLACVGDPLSLTLQDGLLHCRVEEVEQKNKTNS